MVNQQARRPSLKPAASNSSTNTTATDDQTFPSHDSALASAAHAIKQSSPTPRAITHKATPSTGDAVLAALTADRSTRSPANDTTTTTRSIDVARTQSSRPLQQTMNGRQHAEPRSNTLAAPADEHNAPRAKSPSHAAALAAAARAAYNPTALKRQSTLPVARSQNKPAVAAKPRRLSVQSRPLSTSASDSPTDTTSIAPTTSLVSLFEQKSSPVAKTPPRPLVITPTNSVPLASPKPLRSSDGFRTLLQGEMGAAQRVQDLSHVPGEEDTGQEDLVLVASKQAGRRGSSHGEDWPSAHNRSANETGHNQLSAGISAVDNDSNQSAGHHSTGASEGDPLRKIGAAFESEGRRSQSSQGDLIRTPAQESITPARRTAEVDGFPRAQQKAPPLPPRGSIAGVSRTDSMPKPPTPRTMPRPIARPSTAPIDFRAPVNDRKPSQDTLSTSAHSNRSVNATYRHLYPKQSTSLTNDDDLANAIVASSLASSRLGSPQHRETPPLPPSRGQSRHGRSLFHSRTPSPAKSGGLRQTLRKQDSSSSEGEDDLHPYSKHHKKRLIRKHPNKHHEGDRKRWRDAVTEGERKRYEGVWAANKGLYMPPLPKDPTSRMDPNVINDQVSNIVTKDIWSRSRLPDFELEAVWDLVDSEGVGRLSKEEFVVGMWLIDQRLKGRKLPVKVTPTVWTSVRALHGIKVRK